MANICDNIYSTCNVLFINMAWFVQEIFLDLTSFCNHSCVFCSNPLITNKKTMNHEMAIRVIKEAYACGTRELGMYATGDSFMVKNLHEYVKYAKRHRHIICA